jgi:flavodoxin
MRALVVFESMFGNTRTVADAIAEGLGTALEVRLVNVADAPTEVPADVDLVVVGGPTHALGMSRPSTRKSAADEAVTTVTPVATGMREWLDAMTAPPATAGATFDTRVKVRGLPGSAARRAQRRLRRKGVALLAPAATFWVEGTPGPLRDGERDRAVQWGEHLAVLMAERGRTGRTGRTSVRT